MFQTKHLHKYIWVCLPVFGLKYMYLQACKLKPSCVKLHIFKILIWCLTTSGFTLNYYIKVLESSNYLHSHLIMRMSAFSHQSVQIRGVRLSVSHSILFTESFWGTWFCIFSCVYSHMTVWCSPLHPCTVCIFLSFRCVLASSILTLDRCPKSVHTVSQWWHHISNISFHLIWLGSTRWVKNLT